MLKFVITDIDSVDEAYKSLYENDGTGKYVLKVEGAVPKAQVDEFRTNNVALKKAVEAFAGIDPEKSGEFIAARDLRGKREESRC